MKSKLMKLMSKTLVTAMILSSLSPMAAFAADNEIKDSASANNITVSGNGEIVDPDVFTIVVPTDDTVKNTFDFLLDPQQNIKESGHLADGTEATVSDNATVLFKHANDSKYYAQSDAITIKSKSNIELDIDIDASVSGLKDSANPAKYNIALKDADDVAADSTGTSMFLAVSVGGNDTYLAAPANPDGTGTAKVTGSLEAMDADKFEVVVDTVKKKYVKKLKDSVTSGFPEYSFSLKGATNDAPLVWGRLLENEEYKNVKPSVSVVYKVQKKTGPKVTMTPNGVITITGLTAEKNFADYTSFVLKNNTTGESVSPSDANVTFTGLNTTWTAENGGSCTISLNS